MGDQDALGLFGTLGGTPAAMGLLFSVLFLIFLWFV
jgi:hypothetical protein